MREGYALPPPASATPPRRLADLLWSPGVHTVKEHDAGWSSSEARWAHNPEVAGSNPAPATQVSEPSGKLEERLLLCVGNLRSACASATILRYFRDAHQSALCCPASKHPSALVSRLQACVD